MLNEVVLAAMAKVKKDGKARFIGVSTHKNEPEVLRAAVEAKIYDVVLTSYNIKQDHHLEVQKAIGEAAAAGLGIVAMKTQAGLFWDKEKTKPIDMKAALKWSLRDANVHTAIPGFTTLDQLQLDLGGACAIRFFRRRRAKVCSRRSSPVSSARVASSAACRAASTCPSRKSCAATCTDTPTRIARPRSRSCSGSTLPASPCGDCDTCPVICAKGFDVRNRIRDIVRLRDVPREFLI